MTDERDPFNERMRGLWAEIDYNPIATRETLVGELLARAVDVHYGELVLDVAAGTGNTAMAAARRNAEVTASDLVPGNLEKAAQRAAVEGLDIRFELGDVLDLPYEDDSFDVVLSTFGVMYGRDHQRAADELLRVCRPGGRIGLASWVPDGDTAAVQAEIVKVLPVPSGPPGLPPTLWGTEEHCKELFGDRITGLTSTRRVQEFCAASAAAHVEFLRKHLPPFRAIHASLDAEQWEAFATVAAATFDRRNRATDGTYIGSSEYLEVVAIVA